MKTTTTDEVQAWVWLVTLAIPFIAAVINQPAWTANRKRWVSIAVAAVVAAVTLWLQGEFSDLGTGNAIQHVVLVVGAAQIWFTALSAVPVAKDALLRLEAKTSPQPPADSPA